MYCLAVTRHRLTSSLIGVGFVTMSRKRGCLESIVRVMPIMQRAKRKLAKASTQRASELTDYSMALRGSVKGNQSPLAVHNILQFNTRSITRLKESTEHGSGHHRRWLTGLATNELHDCCTRNKSLCFQISLRMLVKFLLPEFFKTYLIRRRVA